MHGLKLPTYRATFKMQVSVSVWSCVAGLELSKRIVICVSVLVGCLSDTSNMVTSSLDSNVPPTWIVRPSNVSQYVGKNASFTCVLDNLGSRRNFIWSAQRTDSTWSVFFFNEIRFNAPDRYYSFPMNGNGSAVGYQLVLTNIQKEDDTGYLCQVQNMGGNDIQMTAQLNVLASPGPPTITTTTNATADGLTEGDQVRLNCSSMGGNPPPNITWLRNGSVLSSTVSINPEKKFGTTSSILLWQVAPSDNSVDFTCVVENGTTAVAAERLNVRYGPIIRFGPYNPLVVIENSSVTLNCYISSNPPVDNSSVVWYAEGQQASIGSGSSLFLSSAVEVSKSGFYVCSAKNFVERRSRLYLDVQYGPRLTAVFEPNTLTSVNALEVNEGSPVRITCLCDSNPAVNSSAIQWIKDGTVVQFGSLIIPSVDRTYSGTYSCKASNILAPSGSTKRTMATKSLNIHLQVLYKPGKAVISLPTVAIKGESVTLRCSVAQPGYPTANVTWTKLGISGILGYGNTLEISPVGLSDIGNYTCTPFNGVGAGVPDTQRLEVYERPERNDGSLLPELLVVKANQTSQVAFNCHVHGRPAPKVLWLKNGLAIDVSSSEFTIQEHSEAIDTYSISINSTLYLEGPSRQPTSRSLYPTDSGNYSCVARNEYSSADLVQTTSLVVQYPPVINTSAFQAVELHRSAEIQFIVFANPRPSFTWYNGSMLMNNNDRWNSQIQTVVGEPDRYVVLLHITVVEDGDYGNYSMEAVNECGSSRSTTSLIHTRIPDPPFDLSFVALSWGSAELTWKAGFDGGNSQTFVISVYSDTGDYHEVIANTTEVNVTGLDPNCNYTFWVTSQNQLGRSSPSKNVTVLLPELIIQAPLEAVFNARTKIVTVTPSVSKNFCIRVDISDGRSWMNVIPCFADPAGKIKLSDSVIAVDLRVYFCLEERPDICSFPVMAKIVSNDGITIETIIIVGCVCGFVVVCLTFILCILCWRRHLATKKHQKHVKAAAASSHIQVHHNGQSMSLPRGVANQMSELPWRENSFRNNINFQTSNGLSQQNGDTVGGNDYWPSPTHHHQIDPHDQPDPRFQPDPYHYQTDPRHQPDPQQHLHFQYHLHQQHQHDPHSPQNSDEEPNSSYELNGNFGSRSDKFSQQPSMLSDRSQGSTRKTHTTSNNSIFKPRKIIHEVIV